MKRSLIIFLLITAGGVTSHIFAQDGYTRVNEKYFPYTIDDCGDTLILANLDGVSISSPRKFANPEDYQRYRRYRRYALKVYPYAVDAIRIFNEVEYATNHMKDRHRKKYIRKLQKDLKGEFNDPLKKLSRTQGMILMKMIEKETGRPMFDLIKDLRGNFTASYWGTMGRLYGHHLKNGYIADEDPILDAVLNDLDVSYDPPRRGDTE